MENKQILRYVQIFLTSILIVGGIKEAFVGAIFPDWTFLEGAFMFLILLLIIIWVMPIVYNWANEGKNKKEEIKDAN